LICRDKDIPVGSIWSTEETQFDNATVFVVLQESRQISTRRQPTTQILILCDDDPRYSTTLEGQIVETSTSNFRVWNRLL
jgi:hypothetical protein